LFSIERGRFISAFDQEHARPVVVLGAAISESLFPNSDALGKTVRINDSTYEVIGVFEHDQGLFLGPGVDIFVVIPPLSNFKKRYPESQRADHGIHHSGERQRGNRHGEVIQALRRLRRIPAGKENDFELSSPDFLSNLWNQLTGALVILTTSSVRLDCWWAHRRDEHHAYLGDRAHARKLAFAKPSARAARMSACQFLLEAVVLTLLGGSIGILIGQVYPHWCATLVPSIPATLSYLWVSIGFAISVGVGLFFGYYPAILPPTSIPSFACGTNEGPGAATANARYLKINKLCEKSAKNACFEKIVLDRKSISVYLRIPQSYTCCILVAGPH